MIGFIASMKKKPQKPRSKPFFCFDVNLEFQRLKKECNDVALFVCSVTLLKSQEAKDLEIISYCNKHDYHIITHNTVDFIHPPENIRIGILCINIKDPTHWLPKFRKVLKAYPKHEDLYYKSVAIGETTRVTDRRKDGNGK